MSSLRSSLAWLSIREVDVVLLRQCVSLLERHSPLVLDIALVADQDLVDVHVRVHLDLRNPVPDRNKRVSVGHVVHQEDALCSAEVRGRDGAEALLSRGVPYLQLDALAVQLDILDLEIDSYRRDEGGGEGVVGVPQQEARFSDTTIADHQQFNLHVECIVSAGHRARRLLSKGDENKWFGRYR
eukprot:CAMPEP_0173177186 /NCGR_PEP_ID=MMETSP1141-20130122/4857_1 /TAXON_ID=483371 /ORGANISM="non described non described, Strain CCMP2298" /LENGTH=183 /DNA_ID=CAMNT_0014099571 /DNA_START=298 /DNA_END=850 /DNA_ORIENTATION=-